MYIYILHWVTCPSQISVNYLIIYTTNVIPNMKVPLILLFLTPVTTITVGSGSSVDITATPTISQPVELWCSRPGTSKQWYTNGRIVTPTPGAVWTAQGRTLGFSTFATSHAGTYSCLVRNMGEVNTTTYTVVLGKSVYI